MTDRTGPERWSTAAWRAGAIAWIDALGHAGIARTGEVEQTRIRPWGTLLAIPTSEGRLWLKAAAPVTAFEVALYPLLHPLAPGTVLEPLAVDTERGWILLADGGTHLSDIVEGEALVAAMETALPLRRAAAPEADTMVALGVADMRPATMPKRFAEALGVTQAFVT